MTRGTLVLAGGLAAAAIGTAGVVVLLGRAPARGPTPDEYLRHASAVCRGFAAKVNRIAPPDLGSIASVKAQVALVLPLLRAQAAAVRAIKRPPELERRLDAQFALAKRSLARLGLALDAARRGDRSAMAHALGAWIVASEDARATSVKLGIRC